MAKIIVGITLFFISAGSFMASFLYFREKGFLLNNAYIYASKQERDNMDKKPHYRQSAIVFLLIGIIFLLNAIETVLNSGWLFYVVLAVGLVTIVYAVVSSISIEKSKKKSKE